MTLLQQIALAQHELMVRRNLVSSQEHIVRNLENLRLDCKHEFNPPYVGYEHEGGNCKLCGINELHNYTLQQNR
jgi:hypothetical protein